MINYAANLREKMPIRLDHPLSLLSQIEFYGNRMVRGQFLLSDSRSMEVRRDQSLTETSLLLSEGTRTVSNASLVLGEQAARIAQRVSLAVMTPFCPILEIIRAATGKISFSIALKNLTAIPYEVAINLLKSALILAESADRLLSIASTMTGMLIWNGGESAVRWFKPGMESVLSDKVRYRDIVYESLGLTALSAVALLTAIPSIQMMALPILFGSIYGSINNQFTVRECPEYYTMGHYFDGESLEGHAIKTNHVLVKPIVTGCYATTMVTKWAGLVLSVAARAPYAAAALPLHVAVKMIASVCAISLAAGHIFSTYKKEKLLQNLREHSELIGLELNDETLNKTPREWAVQIDQLYNERCRELQGLHSTLLVRDFHSRELALREAIEEEILSPDVPIRYIAGWQANNTRNSIGYIAAGAGTIGLSIATVVMRVFGFVS